MFGLVDCLATHPTGEVLFARLPRDLWVTFHLPGVARPIEALRRVVWHGPAATARNKWGCGLLDMSLGCRKVVERVLATPPRLSGSRKRQKAP